MPIMHMHYRHLIPCGRNVYLSGPECHTKQELDFLHFELAIVFYLTPVELGKKNWGRDRQYLGKEPEWSWSLLVSLGLGEM